MSVVEIITLFVTILCLLSFCAVFTILFRHYYKSNTDAITSGKEDIALIDNAIDEEKAKQKKSKKIFGWIGKILSYILLGAVFVFFVFSLISKIGNDSLLFGNSGFVVIASGSMSEKNNNYVKNNDELNNQFDTYDIIGISKYGSQNEVKLYDVIAYHNKKNVTIVHRIVEIHQDSDGNDIYLTQGDTNLYADNSGSSQYSGYLTYDKIIGKYDSRRVKGLGIFVIFLQSPAGIVTILAVVYCLFMYDRYAGRYKKAILERTNMLVKLIDYDVGKQDGSDLKANYHETLLYKDQVYTFRDGKFIDKKEAEVPLEDDSLLFLKKENGHNTLTVTDTKDNTSKVYEDVSEEDMKNIQQFAKDKKKE